MDSTKTGLVEIRSKFPTRMLVLLPMILLLFWVIAAAVVWWAYSISALIHGGYYEQHQAVNLVSKMGFLITALTSVVWVFRIVRDNGDQVE
jgi:hypothetical protein